MAETESDPLAVLRALHRADEHGSNVHRCVMDGQVWPCDAAGLLDVAEAARALIAVVGCGSDCISHGHLYERWNAALDRLAGAAGGPRGGA